MTKKVLSFILSLTLIFGLFTSFTASAADYSTVKGKYNYDFAMKVLELVNEARAAEGLGKLVMTKLLTEAAMLRSAEQVESFSHTRPNGEDCYTAFEWHKAAGENVAMLFDNPQKVFDAWMASPGHRKNIMASYYTLIGIGCFIYDVDGHGYWAQEFSGGSDNEFKATGTKDVSVNIGIAPHAKSSTTVIKDNSTYSEGEVKGDSYVPKPSTDSVYVNRKTVVNSKGMGKGAKAEQVDAYLAQMSSESDPKDTSFSTLALKQGKVTKNSVSLSWAKPAGTKYFVVYSNLCGSSYKYKKRATITATSYKVGGMFSNTYYKFIVCAFDSNNNLIASSFVTHAATAGGKNSNPKSIKTKAKKNKVTLAKKGKKFKLKGKIVKPKKKKVKTHRKPGYESSNPQVATVDSKGVITAKKKGSCKIYVYAQNGAYKVIKVKVKK